VAAKIDAALAERMKSGVPEIKVEIQFSETPPAAQVQALGLKSEGKLAWGILSREKIEAIATVPQVVAIRLSERPFEPASTAPGQRIGPGLAIAMQMKPHDRHHVSVRFRRPPKALPPIENLAVHGSSGNGRLSTEEIEALARYDDVLTIELFPKEKLF
jgi:hypothetical protein